MLIEHDATKMSRSAAWRKTLQNRPRFEVDGMVFQPSDRDFRKDHGWDPEGQFQDTWAYYVTRWGCVEGDARLDNPPSTNPAPLSVGPHEEKVSYVWDSWKDHKGNEVVGFALTWDVHSRKLKAQQPTEAQGDTPQELAALMRNYIL